RSFFKDYSFTDKTAYNYYYNQSKQYWVKQNLYHQALLGLAFSRNDELDFVIKNILPSITENATNNKQGMYWKENYTSFWYQSPIEFESTMIGFMNEINEQKTNPIITKNIANMRTWLILNKQTNNWKTTVATADACYALIAGNETINNDKQVIIKLGNYNINSSQQKQQIGTGYFKQRIDGSNVKPEMGNVTITTKSQNPAISKSDISYGSLYWQYFEDFDKITASASPLSITKKLFVEKNSDNGKILSLITENDELKIGDKIIIRLELRTDRDMDYVHLKDTRAATMEPINVLSSYKYQDGLGYYEATKDASTNFFFGNIRKGVYVFEYPVYLSHSGTFSIGIANLQCMYAPEFTSHSEGFKIKVSER
ncbi:MAG: alpha-2-macroglobulin, partial [Pedobacter sp.]|nr:alpha-2-macroglobulin [Chitinophagaceae bacterium]